ncbi:MAG TPA: hypothetical protein VLE73_04200 [Candidatus Saccharimonadales bacterium]|nr:hypothetical protein [Candidatus Saccharimonadales bacterium]
MEPQAAALPQEAHEPSYDDPDSNLVAFIDELQKIDLNSPLAKLNPTSISDNNGGRIAL